METEKSCYNCVHAKECATLKDELCENYRRVAAPSVEYDYDGSKSECNKCGHHFTEEQDICMFHDLKTMKVLYVCKSCYDKLCE